MKEVETCPKKSPCACDEDTKCNVPVLFLFSLWRVLSREGLLSLSRQACLLCGWSHLLALEMWIYDKGSNLAARWQNLNAGHRHTCAPTLIHLTHTIPPHKASLYVMRSCVLVCIGTVLLWVLQLIRLTCLTGDQPLLLPPCSISKATLQLHHSQL